MNSFLILVSHSSITFDEFPLILIHKTEGHQFGEPQPFLEFTSFADKLVLYFYLPQSSWVISNELKLISNFKGLTNMVPLILFPIHLTFSF